MPEGAIVGDRVALIRMVPMRLPAPIARVVHGGHITLTLDATSQYRTHECWYLEQMAMAATPQRTFDPRAYWERRLRAHGSIQGVGYLSDAAAFVRLQYVQRAGQLRRLLRRLGLSSAAGKSVLDVGSGIGLWIDYWRSLGATEVTALDFTTASVGLLRQRYPDVSVVEADISAARLPAALAGTFDIVSCFDVMLHIVDPDGFVRAMTNLARLTRAGGVLVLCDPLLAERGYAPTVERGEHVRLRSVADYVRILERAGCPVDTIVPATALLNDPLEARSRPAYRMLVLWQRLLRPVRHSEVWARTLGPALIAVDSAACSLAAALPPSEKILIARKRVPAS